VRSLRSAFAALESERRRRVAVGVFVLVLLVATAVAFANAQRLKLERSPVTAPRLDRVLGPTCGCDRAVARLEIRLRRADVLDASVVDGQGEEVRRLESDLRRPTGKVAFSWDGRDDSGEVVPDGRYRLRIRLHDARRTITVPTPVRVDSTPPRIRLASAKPHVISPDGDGRGDRVRYVYRVNELAHPWVVVEGADTFRGRMQPPGPGRVRWRGRIGGEPAKAGTYETRLVAEDEAGNRSERTRPVAVRVRYVDLIGVPRRVRPGALIRFFVDADAKEVTVRLESRRGRGNVGRLVRRAPGAVALRAPRAGGTYAVVAAAQAHADEALVRVARRARALAWRRAAMSPSRRRPERAPSSRCRSRRRSRSSRAATRGSRRRRR
jgi:hypothetical protein